MENFIGLFSCFKDLPPEDIAVFNNKKTQVRYLKGEIVVKQGAFADNVFFVNEGLVRKYIQLGADKQKNIRLVKTGNFMAIFTIFGETVYPYSAMALKESTVCMIEKQVMIDILTRNPKFAIEVMSKNYKKEHRYIEIIHDLTYKQMRGKVASALLYLSSDDFVNENVFQLLTRQDIADFASVTIESSIKFIKEFEKERIIEFDNKKIIISDKKALEKISKIG